jgi:3-deoxy-D-manno-octulosonic-acid transferase
MNWSILYRFLTLVALPFALLYHWYRSISRGRKSAFAERFGFLAHTAELLTGHPSHLVACGFCGGSDCQPSFA